MTFTKNQATGNPSDKLDQKTIITKVIVLLLIAFAFVYTAMELNLFYLKLVLAPVFLGWILDIHFSYHENLLKITDKEFFGSTPTPTSLTNKDDSKAIFKGTLFSTTSLFYSTIILSICMILAV
ncbi:hypothetical protein GCM10028791_21630 [Echinicola sediminis]